MSILELFQCQRRQKRRAFQ
jgi:hypothetical protein